MRPARVLVSAGLSLLVSLFALACGDNSEVTPDSLTVSPSSVTLSIGETATVGATYQFAGEDTPATDVTWSSSNTATATVTGTGAEATITAHAGGSATITASGQGRTATVAVAVSDAALVSIAITPPAPQLAAGTDASLTATGTYSDDSTADITATATWTTDDGAVATVAVGVVSGVAPGTATITAAVGTIEGTAEVEVTDATLVSLAVEPVDPSVALGTDPQFTATGTFSDTTTQDLTDQVTWSSSLETIATIDATGLAETHATGQTVITASLDGVSDTSTLTVTDATLDFIEVTPFDPAVPLGVDQQFTATGHFSDGSTDDLTAQVAWSSGTPAVATIDANGLAESLTTGTTIISATLDGEVGTSQLTVTAATLQSIDISPGGASIALGVDQQFTATGNYSDGTSPDITTSVTWASTNDSVAQISNDDPTRGLATSLAAGTTTITATLDGVTGMAGLEVTAATLDSITIAPEGPSVALGVDPQFAATGHYSDGSTPDLTALVTWGSSDEAVAEISNADGSQGLVTTLTAGQTTISATLDGVSASTTLDVTAATLESIAVTPADPSVTLGTPQQFVATGTYSDSSSAVITDQVTWSSLDTGVAQISNADGSHGLATTLGVGSTTITASLEGVDGTTTLTVTAAPVPPAVASTTPADGATSVLVTSTVAVTFTLAIAPATLTTQATAGACGGSLQVSADDFATCIGLGAPVMSDGDTVGTVTPAAPLAYATTYKLRVLGTVTGASGTPMGATFTQATGFSTEPLPACLPGLVISQVYGGGGNTGAPYTHDFIELHNPTLAPISTGGHFVQFSSATGTGNWAVQTLPAVTVPAGGFFLIQEAAGAASPGPLPTPDFIPLGGFMMGSTSGKVALTNTNTPLVGTTVTAAVVDLVGYGTTANTFEGAGPAPAPSNTTADIRANGGCTDANNNATDFVAAPPTPRNISTVTACACQ
jgi:hypothetical protein